MGKRRDKHNYYLDIAETVAKRCTCLRRHYGVVIVKNDEIISTGYVGAPRGRKNCTDMGVCVREKTISHVAKDTSCAEAFMQKQTQ